MRVGTCSTVKCMLPTCVHTHTHTATSFRGLQDAKPPASTLYPILGYSSFPRQFNFNEAATGRIMKGFILLPPDLQAKFSKAKPVTKDPNISVQKTGSTYRSGC